MNTAQINNDTETGEEAIEDEYECTTVSNNNRYNLRTRPTKRNNKYTLLQEGQQSTKVAIAEPQAHVILTQMKVREGIKNLARKETRHYSRN